MKKIFSILLVVVMMCSALVMTVFAAGPDPVISPEKDNTVVDKDPTSPQTGYAVGIGGVAVIALACGAVAVVSARKASRS